MEYFGTPTTTTIPTPTISSEPSSLLVPSSSLLNFSGDFQDLMHGNSMPIMDEFIWNSAIHAHPVSPSLLYPPLLEVRLQELVSKLVISHYKLSERLDGDVPPFLEEIRNVLFTVPNLIDFTRLFFDHWYPNCPVIHQPTYNLETVSLPLLLVVFLIGAAYSSPRDTAILAGKCGALCEEFVFEDDELKSILHNECGTSESTSLQIVQAAFLVSVLQNWQNGPLARKRMRTRRYCDIVTCARVLEYTSSRNMYATGIYPFNWIGYAEAEAKVRSAC